MDKEGTLFFKFDALPRLIATARLQKYMEAHSVIITIGIWNRDSRPNNAALRQNLNMSAAAKAIHEAGITAFDAPRRDRGRGCRNTCRSWPASVARPTSRSR